MKFPVEKFLIFGRKNLKIVTIRSVSIRGKQKNPKNPYRLGKMYRLGVYRLGSNDCIKSRIKLKIDRNKTQKFFVTIRGVTISG